jgi:hypothetical protein
VRPLRFATAAGSLFGLDRLPAGFADLPGGVGEVIFPRTLADVAAIGIRNSDLALAVRPARTRESRGSLGERAAFELPAYPAG